MLEMRGESCYRIQSRNKRDLGSHGNMGGGLGSRVSCPFG